MLQTNLSPEFKQAVMIRALIFGFIAAALIIATVFVARKCRALGVIAGIVELLFIVTSAFYDKIPFYDVLQKNHRNRLHRCGGRAENGCDLKKESMQMMKDMLSFVALSFLVFIGWLLCMILLSCIGRKGITGLKVPAIIIHIVSYYLITPFPVAYCLLTHTAMREEIQNTWYTAFLAAMILPLILILLSVILKKCASAKTDAVKQTTGVTGEHADHAMEAVTEQIESNEEINHRNSN